VSPLATASSAFRTMFALGVPVPSGFTHAAVLPSGGGTATVDEGHRRPASLRCEGARVLVRTRGDPRGKRTDPLRQRIRRISDRNGPCRNRQGVESQDPEERRRHLCGILALDGVDLRSVRGGGEGRPIPDPQDDVPVGIGVPCILVEVDGACRVELRHIRPGGVQVGKLPRLLSHGREDGVIQAELPRPGQGGRIHAALKFAPDGTEKSEVDGEPAEYEEKEEGAKHEQQHSTPLISKEPLAPHRSSLPFLIACLSLPLWLSLELLRREEEVLDLLPQHFHASVPMGRGGFKPQHSFCQLPLESFLVLQKPGIVGHHYL